MKKKILPLCGLLLAAALFGACQKQPSTSAAVETSAREESDIHTIFDKVVKGTVIDETAPLYDITAEYTLEGYDIVNAVMTEEYCLAVLYRGEADCKIVNYDFTTGKKVNTVLLSEKLTEEARLVSTSDFMYLVDGATLYVPNLEAGKYTVIATEEDWQNFFVSAGGDSLYFDKKGSAVIYRYIFETGNTVEVFDASEYAPEITLKSVSADDITMLVSYNEGKKYARVVPENQTWEDVKMAEDMIYENGVALYAESGQQVIDIYNERKPRLKSSLTLEDSAETDNVFIFGDESRILTMVLNTSDITFRFYDALDGIMVNSLVLSADYDLKDCSFSYDYCALLMDTYAEDGTRHLLIWDIEDVNEIIK